MMSAHSTLFSLTPTSSYPHISISDSHLCPIKGNILANPILFPIDVLGSKVNKPTNIFIKTSNATEYIDSDV